ncbi:MAG: hypothetical protein EBR28_02885 [Planctomycetia bacterium]|nr:hypothetical protein [Planctomycetia bacterium]
MSFFQWIREGVRQAVVLGLADAVEDVGTRVREEDLGPALAQTLRERLAVAAPDEARATVVEAPGLSAAPRRRLGRSLDAGRDASRKAA